MISTAIAQKSRIQDIEAKIEAGERVCYDEGVFLAERSTC